MVTIDNFVFQVEPDYKQKLGSRSFFHWHCGQFMRRVIAYRAKDIFPLLLLFDRSSRTKKMIPCGCIGYYCEKCRCFRTSFGG